MPTTVLELENKENVNPKSYSDRNIEEHFNLTESIEKV